MYLKAHGLGGQTSRICLVTAGINCIFVFGIKSQFDSKKSNERVCAHLSITPFIVYAERLRSATRDLGLSIGTDFITSPLHCLVRMSLL
jgi:hypothetical protein